MANKKLKGDSKSSKISQDKRETIKKQGKSRLIPSTILLVYEALDQLDNKKANGSSFKAIKKYIAAKYNVDVKDLIPTCKQVIKQEINVNNIIQVGRKFLVTQRKDHRYVKPKGKKSSKNKVVAIDPSACDKEKDKKQKH